MATATSTTRNTSAVKALKRRLRLWAIRHGHYRLYRAILFRTEPRDF